MNLLVIGAGPVGLVTAVCFANSGKKVYINDKDAKRLKSISSGKPAFFEHELEKGLSRAIRKGALLPVDSIKEGFADSGIIFVCVGTPTIESGGQDMSQVNSVLEELAPLIRKSKSRKIIIIRSTVLPGTTIGLTKRLEELALKRHPLDFGMVANPEFMRQGNAMGDFLRCNKLVIGSEHKEDAETVRKLYWPFGLPAAMLSTKEAETAKYVSNCMSAVKISLINEIGRISKMFDVDINKVSDALDLRVGIGNFPLSAGCGFGGGCLDKDIRAFLSLAQSHGLDAPILRSALDVNESLPASMADALEGMLGGLEGKTVGLLGLSFKKGTDDIRNSRAIPLIRELQNRGVLIKAYDPKAMGKMKKIFPEIGYPRTPQKLIDGSEGVIILSDWEEFSALDYGDKAVVDGRNIVPKEKRGKRYEGVCWP